MVMVGWMLRLRRTTCRPGLVQTVGAAAPQRCHDGAVGGAKFRADAEHRRERGRHCEPAPVLIDFVFKTREALSVGAGLALQDDGPPRRSA